jgi:hypothetical protein
LGKGFFIKSDGRVVEWRRQRLEANRVAFAGDEVCQSKAFLKICVVDAFVYGLAFSIESLGFLPEFYKFNVNLLEVSL